MSTTALPTRPGPTARVRVEVVAGDGVVRTLEERVATEEPLAIRVVDGQHHDPVTLTVTMRTPGHDFELAVGHLLGEGLIGGIDDLEVIRYCGQAVDEQEYNVVTVRLTGARPHGRAADARSLTSADTGLRARPELVASLPRALRDQQRATTRTCGLHAAGLFDLDGAALVVREDIRRPNAVAKVIGWAVMERRLPLHDDVLVVGGRVGAEVVQMAVAAGVDVVAAESAPSGRAIDLARDHGLALVGNAGEDRLSVYSGPARLGLAASSGR